MSNSIITPTIVGNEFSMLQVQEKHQLNASTVNAVLEVSDVRYSGEPNGDSDPGSTPGSPFRRLVDIVYRYSIITGAVLLLFLSISASRLVLAYESSAYAKSVTRAALISDRYKSSPSLVFSVSRSQLQSTIAAITSQPINLSLGSQTIPISSTTINSWLKVTPDTANANDENVFIKTSAMTSSLEQTADDNLIAPVNQVSVTHDDGITPSGTILAGQNGTKLANPNGLASQVQSLAPGLSAAKGLSFNAPTVVAPFQAVTPAAFNKLIEVDVTTKRMYVYQSGQLINTFLVSAGKPSTPTPIGEFHIWAKLTNQTMTGPGYVQPNVPWINYFDHSGDAIHGNYWRPASVFGNINTSHGCVGLQVSDAEWIYDWAPIGTTVITYA